VTLDTKPTLTTFRQSVAQVSLRIAAYGLALGLALSAVWLAHTDWGAAVPSALPTPVASATPAPIFAAAPQALPELGLSLAGGSVVSRQAVPHTTIPTRPDYSIQTYTVEANDTLFSIALKFQRKPATILWGNPALAANPNILSVGKELNILPVEGALREVMKGDTVENIAKAFHGKVEDILNFPGNNLDPLNPKLEPGQAIIIPGGYREQVVWQAPKPVGGRATVGRSWGNGQPGACAGPFSGPAGSASFTWPTASHYLSGWSFMDPGEPSHMGVDLAAKTGAGVYAADTGVIIFAGWNTWGYGNMIMIDHGNGWQTLYGHLSQINVVCGQPVYQGNLIGLAGNTGNSYGAHLHFEMRNDQLGRVNPWSYLP
jgi:LysM repeat protein